MNPPMGGAAAGSGGAAGAAGAAQRRQRRRRRPRGWAALAALVLLLAAAPLAPRAAGEEQPPAGGAQAPPACAPPRAPVRVLALGDSLTNGAVPSAKANHPYTLRLGEVLRAELAPRPVDITLAGARVWVCGLCSRASGLPHVPRPRSPWGTARCNAHTRAAVNGAGTILAAPDAAGRNTTLPALLERALAGGVAYDVIILLAGINDLGRGNKTAGAVYDAVIAMVDRAAAAARGAVIVVAPWANRFVSRASDNETQRRRLNAALGAALGGGGGGAGAAPRVLLNTIEGRDFAFWGMDGARRARLQDDALHLTAAGYDALGQDLAAQLVASGVARDLKCG